MKPRESALLCMLCLCLGSMAGARWPHTQAAAHHLSTDEDVNVEVYRIQSPGVVNVTSTTYVRDFFDVYPEKGTGSGSIFDARGLVLTNFHVVRGAQDLQVTLADKSTHSARIVGTDPEDDLAVIRIVDPPPHLHVIELASSESLLVGQKVLAIGNPFGLDRTLTTGVVSGLGRPLKTEAGTTIQNVIQTDAAINPGNSGGPLLNSDGRMVGVNTAIYSPSGGSIGIGFAIPVSVVKKVLGDLETRGRVVRPWLGIASTPLTPRLAHGLNLPIHSGLIVTGVTPGGPAARAGLRAADNLVERDGHWVLPADVIVRLNGRATPDADALSTVLMDISPTASVTLDVLRDGRTIPVRVQLAPRPAQTNQ